MIEYNVTKLVCLYREADMKVGDCAIDFIYLGAIISDIQVTYITKIKIPNYALEETTYTIRGESKNPDKKSWQTLADMISAEEPMNDIVNFMEFMAL